jgi:hypothetical protein
VDVGEKINLDILKAKNMTTQKAGQANSFITSGGIRPPGRNRTNPLTAPIAKKGCEAE